VFGLKNAEIEVVVADLVTAEVLCLGWPGSGDKRKQTHHDRREPTHGAPLELLSE
jgi:hypothetical protein